MISSLISMSSDLQRRHIIERTNGEAAVILLDKLVKIDSSSGPVTMASASGPVAMNGNAHRHAGESFSFSLFHDLNENTTQLLCIHGYSTIEKILHQGRCVESPPFRAGGHMSTVEYYPNGHAESMRGHASVALRHKGIRFLRIGNVVLGDASGATASYRVSFLFFQRNVVYIYSVKPQHYEERWAFRWSDVMRFMAEKRMKKLRLEEEDFIFVKCEFAVQKLDTKSRIKTFHRELLDLYASST